MNTNIATVLKNTIKLLAEHEELNRKDNYAALADTLRDQRREIENLLVSNTAENMFRKERPFLAKGLDDKLYLVFDHSGQAGHFLNNLGISEFSVGLHHFGGYENAVLVDINPRTEDDRKGLNKPDPDNVVHEAETWLRAISTWLLENDYDMQLPDGVLDTDPEDIAERLEQFRLK